MAIKMFVSEVSVSHFNWEVNEICAYMQRRQVITTGVSASYEDL